MAKKSMVQKFTTKGQKIAQPVVNFIRKGSKKGK